ncbi:heat shock 70 kDa protein-like [Capsicum chacoense]
MEPVGKCLNEAKVDNVHIQEMVLVSRSSRLPIIQHLLMNYIDEKKLYASINLDDDATCGAAVLHTILIGNGDENVQELLVRKYLNWCVFTGKREAENEIDKLLSRKWQKKHEKNKSYTKKKNKQETSSSVY